LRGFRLKDVGRAGAEIAGDGDAEPGEDGAAATERAAKIPLQKSLRREELHQLGAGRQSHVKAGIVDSHEAGSARHARPLLQ